MTHSTENPYMAVYKKENGKWVKVAETRKESEWDKLWKLADKLDKDGFEVRVEG